MSLYTSISKELGHTKRDIVIPNEEEILILIDKAKNKDVNAFKKLFEIVRFAPTGDPKIILSVNTAYSGYLETRDLFQ